MDVLTLEGETALRRLGALQAFLRIAKPATVTLRSRLSRPRAPVAHTPASVPAGHARTLQEVVLVRAVSVVEAYVFDLTENEIRAEESAIAAGARGRKLVQHLVDDRWSAIESAGAWVRLLEFSKDGLGLNPKAFNEWQQLDLLRETRHAIVHRVGEVTPKYLKAAENAGRLKELGLEASKVSGLVPLGDEDAERQVELCRRFVLWHDGVVRGARLASPPATCLGAEITAR
jgi:hypothetical protein